MTALTRTINDADRIAALWRAGLAPAMTVLERLAAMGFYAIEFGDRRITAQLDGLRLTLGENS